MSIRLVSKESLATQCKKSAQSSAIPALLLADLDKLYSHRAERLRQLAINHPLSDYLLFTAKIAQAQNKVNIAHPLRVDLSDRLTQRVDESPPPLDWQTYPRDAHWHRLLNALIAELRPQVSAPIDATLETLNNASFNEREKMAQALLSYRFADVGSDKAPFLWAALSLYWGQMANQLSAQGHAQYGEHRQFCPVCGGVPVASTVHIGTHNGLRYLHCNLCESQWHMVRVKCSHCEQTGALQYWSLDSEQAVVKAESCDDCGSYLKIIYQERETQAEVVADDLATLVLDAKMEAKGFARSSFNPLLFPAQ